MLICGRRTSSAWSRFRDQNLVLKMGPEIGTRAREKTATMVSIFWRWGLAILRVCGAIRRAPVADSHLTLDQPRLVHEAAQPAAPQRYEGRRWPSERGGRTGTRHVTANSAVSLCCPPVLVPPSGPVLRTVLVTLSCGICSQTSGARFRRRARR